MTMARRRLSGGHPVDLARFCKVATFIQASLYGAMIESFAPADPTVCPVVGA